MRIGAAWLIDRRPRRRSSDEANAKSVPARMPVVKPIAHKRFYWHCRAGHPVTWFRAVTSASRPVIKEPVAVSAEWVEY
jgi:hypothetical protein